MSMSNINIDSELLITLVEARPVLWDKTLDNYKDRNLTRNTWNEVCIELNSEFEELEAKEKNAFGKEVVRRWTNLRDAFAKSLKKMKESKSSGSAAKKLKQYVYNDKLQFLIKLYAERETSNSLCEDDGSVEVQNNVVLHRVRNPLATENEATNPTIFKKPATQSRKHKKVDEVELKILKALEPKEPEKTDPNMSFFQSLLPHLKNFNAEDILQFQMGVLQVISNLNERKRGTVHPPQYSQHNYHSFHLSHPSFPQPPPCHNQHLQSLLPTQANPILYHQNSRSPLLNQFSQSLSVPSHSQPLATATSPTYLSPAHCSPLSYTPSNTPLLSENNDSFSLDKGTECRKPMDRPHEGSFTPEATYSEICSPESTASSACSIDFTF
ncbi:madf domain transcription factor [Holotrichia oblita]|uniref:Madf domain transcription factor n=1 Tax=Holotrichia oblita TaxID=644536 RepID=A0ACB9TD57_HOLOL|nr:madf domain transcription factor [Holotrichia oblita]